MSISHPGSPSTLPLSHISAGYNPRRYFDAKKHAELVASMRLRGMLQPMLLRPAMDQADLYVIVAGGAATGRRSRRSVPRAKSPSSSAR